LIWFESVNDYAICLTLKIACASAADRFQFDWMLYEPTTLASVARLIGETLEADYQIDAQAVFAKLRIDTSKFRSPGARISYAKMDLLWREAIAATDDSLFGFKVGKHALPSDFYVLGHAWLASATLLEALQRLCRYRSVLSSLTNSLEVQPQTDGCALIETYPQGSIVPPKAAKDGGYAALLSLCEGIVRRPIRPLSAALTVPLNCKSEAYDMLFRCPVSYASDKDVLIFAAKDLEEPLTGSIPEVASASDRIAEKYIASLDEGRVVTAVRQQLVQMLPSGRSDQETVAQRLYRSTSTLQRQLGAEGTNYRSILETTRKELAEQYLEDPNYSQAQIAFMLGFSDQSNFARAFKRWTGTSPGDYQRAE
jgi:AraC-like DNA-binding protein